MISNYRTSSTAWVDSNEYPDHPELAAIEQRIAEITHFPVKNQETFQVLRYSEGEYYQGHFDLIEQHAEW